MIKDILAGQYTSQPQQPIGLPQMMPQMQQMPQMMPQVQFDPYGQQNTGVRAALLGRMFNGF